MDMQTERQQTERQQTERQQTERQWKANRHQALAALIPAPGWLSDLILYEIATKSFTSPQGPQSGTFESLRQKLTYVRDLGATGIWLTGHSLADPTHFYNIWTQYAVIEPDVFDPSLGSAAEFHRLIETAHELGLKVILEVVTHGVMDGSPLVQQHPHWFKGGSWGMTDFDWAGHHPDLDDWWVDLWVNYVERYGIDGFRLDVATYRWDLWQRIRRRAADLGHPIVIVTEHSPAALGVNDIYQRSSIRLSDQLKGLDQNCPLLKDMARFMASLVTPFSERYAVRVEGKDGSCLSTEDGVLKIVGRQMEEAIHQDERGEDAWMHYLVILDLAGVSLEQAIDDVIVSDEFGQEWHAKPWMQVDSWVTFEQTQEGLRLRFPAKYPPGQVLAVQLSSHDDGWDGSALDKNPYVAQGSRFVFGYGFLLTPAVPLFMSGEEFNADYRPLPQLSPRLFGGEQAGQGRWLYGSWLDWDQLKDPHHAAMLADVKELIAIRKRFSHLIHPLRVGDTIEHLIPIATGGAANLPVPYLYGNEDECLLVVGNPQRTQEVEVECHLPLASLGWQHGGVTVTDLWSGQQPYQTDVVRAGQMSLRVPRDGVERGGLAIYHLRRS